MREPIIQLNGWITIKDLAEKRGCSTNNISKFIRLRKIPYREYPELNNLKLVPEDWKADK